MLQGDGGPGRGPLAVCARPASVYVLVIRTGSKEHEQSEAGPDEINRQLPPGPLAEEKTDL